MNDKTKVTKIQLYYNYKVYKTGFWFLVIFGSVSIIIMGFINSHYINEAQYYKGLSSELSELLVISIEATEFCVSNYTDISYDDFYLDFLNHKVYDIYVKGE